MTTVLTLASRSPQRRAILEQLGVHFRVEVPDVEWYLGTGEWRNRAGGYAIQGRGAALVEAIEGDFWNVVGLPVPQLLELAPDLLRLPPAPH